MTRLKDRGVYWLVGITLVVAVNKAFDRVDWLKSNASDEMHGESRRV